MKALVYRGTRHLELEEVPDPSGDVVVQVLRAGICGTDVKAYQRGHHYFKPPTILGHECYGKIYASNVPEFQKGDIVVVAPYLECGHCRKCKLGLGELCSAKIFIKTGCFTEYIAFSSQEARKLLFKINEETEAMVLAEPLSCVFNGVRKCGDGDKPLIVGGGPMGALFACYFKLRGQIPIIVEPSNWRAHFLQNLGFQVVSPAQLHRAEGYNPLILCVDKPDLPAEYVPLVEDGGTLLLFAGYAQDATISIDPFHIHYREVSIRGSFGYSAVDFQQSLAELTEHSAVYDKIITHRFSLKEFAEAFSVLEKGEGLKVIFDVEHSV
jgi:L-iditol 2-dehydrogenase